VRRAHGRRAHRAARSARGGQRPALAAGSGQRSLVVAHSRGGQFARVAAVRRPDLVTGLVTLGTPFQQLALHPILVAYAATLGVLGSLGVPHLARVSCLRGRHCAPYRRDLSAPWHDDVPFVSVYSTEDRTVRWRTCLDPGAEHIEVHGSHASLLVSRPVYAELAAFAGRCFDAERDRY
jgi:triacylglycerol lipase